MELSLQRPLLFFDIESTGLNIASDGIIELSFLKVQPDGQQQQKTWKIRPWDYEHHSQIPIAPSASAVNGVKDEDLTGCPRFIEVVEEVADWLRDSDLAGFNSTKFDLPLLAEEIERVKAYCENRIADPKVPADKKDRAREMLRRIDVDLHAGRMVDVQNIYHFMEPRNLRAAYRFYCGGKDFENAHTAAADTLATFEVLKAQLDMYHEPDAFHEQTLKNDVKALSEVGGRPKGIDFAGRIIDKDGVPTISFGKYRDRPVRDIYKTDRSYFAWIDQGDFTLDTKRQFRLLKEQFAREDAQAARQAPSAEQIDLLLSRFGKG